MIRCRFLAVATLVAAALLSGCPSGDPNDPNFPFDPNDPNGLSGGDTLALFEEVWDTFDQTYSYFELKDISWGALYAEYAPNFQEELSADVFAERLAVFLRELNDLHINVRKPDGTYLEVATRDVATNYTSSPRNRYTTNGYEKLGDNVWHGWLTSNIAYLRVDTLASDAFTGISDADINSLFAKYAAASGFIVDLRPNNGGDETVAQRFAGHFTDHTVIYGYTQTRNGPAHDDFGPTSAKQLTAAASARFTGPVVCLIGERNMSSAEWFALMMRACGATLVGDTTRGSSGNPHEYQLANGVSYTVPTWIAYTADMDYIEDRGITPDEAIPAASSFDSSRDYVVERAMQLLGG